MLQNSNVLLNMQIIAPDTANKLFISELLGIGIVYHSMNLFREFLLNFLNGQ